MLPLGEKSGGTFLHPMVQTDPTALATNRPKRHVLLAEISHFLQRNTCCLILGYNTLKAAKYCVVSV